MLLQFSVLRMCLLVFVGFLGGVVFVSWSLSVVCYCSLFVVACRLLSFVVWCLVFGVCYLLSDACCVACVGC